MSDRRVLLVCAAAFAVFYLAFAFLEPKDEVVLFFDYSQRFDAGELPYRDFNTGYPPLALAFILAPGLFTDSIHVYFAVYAAVDTVFMFLTLWVILRICRRFGCSNVLAAVAYMAVTLIYYNQAIRKFDIGAAFFMALAVMLFLERRHALAYPMALIGGLIKFFPMLVIPVFLVLTIGDRKAYRGTIIGVAVCAATVLGALAALALAGFDLSSVTYFMEENASRGFQEESMVGSASIVICRLLGMDYGFIYSNYTNDVDNAICNALQDFWFPVTVACYLAVILFGAYYVLRREAPPEGEDLFKATAALCFASVVVFILANKVFSTTYIQWFYPFIPLLACLRGRADYVWFLAFCVAVAAISWSTPTFGCRYGLLVFRDLLLLYLALLCCRCLRSGRWRFLPDRADELLGKITRRPSSS